MRKIFWYHGNAKYSFFAGISGVSLFRATAKLELIMFLTF
jgi:hypothetical protein